MAAPGPTPCWPSAASSPWTGWRVSIRTAPGWPDTSRRKAFPAWRFPPAAGARPAHRLRPGPGRASATGGPTGSSRSLSDGECDEGSTWEAILFAGHHGLENLVAVVDYNKIQSLGHCKDVLDLDPFAAKWSSFGWATARSTATTWRPSSRPWPRVPHRAGKAHLRDRPHRQGQGRQLHGRQAPLALPHAARGRVPAGDRGNRGRAMRTAFIKTITEMAQRDPRVTLVVGDLGFGVVTDFAQRFPDQFLNAGVAEQNMTGVAAGMAMAGRVVFTYSIGNFPTLRCLEQIRNDVCYHKANVVVTAVGGGFAYGGAGHEPSCHRGPGDPPHAAGDQGHRPRRPAGGRRRRARRGGRHRPRLSPPGPGRRTQRPPGTAGLDARQGHHGPQRDRR